MSLKQWQSQASELEEENQALLPNKENPLIKIDWVKVAQDLRYLEMRLENAVLVEPITQLKNADTKCHDVDQRW